MAGHLTLHLHFHDTSTSTGKAGEGADDEPTLQPLTSSTQDEPLRERINDERELYGMNVRFTTREKITILQLSAIEGRSQHQIIKRMLRPLLIEAARKLEPEV